MKRKPLDNCDSCPFTAEEVADMYLRANLTVALEEYFLEQQVSHAQISHLLGIALLWVKDLMDGKAEKFSSEELLDFCSKVGLQIDPFEDLSPASLIM